MHRLSEPDPPQILPPEKGLSNDLTDNWSYPTAIRFGAGRISEMRQACAAAGIKNRCLSPTRGWRIMAITTQDAGSAGGCGLGPRHVCRCGSEPERNQPGRWLQVYRDGGHDGVIAFGGGSGLDLGKMVAFMAGQTRPVWDYEDVGDWWTRADADAIAPIIAVPTTAGTGSEVGRASC